MISENRAREFFHTYSVNMNNALLQKEIQSGLLTASFSEYFVGASPTGVVGGRNDEQFKGIIEEGVRFYQRIGIQGMNSLSCSLTVMDDYHALTVVEWQCLFKKPSSESGEILFKVHYLLQELDGTIKIFGYITGDEAKALRENGLI